jgi:hypothetical protein
MSLIVIPGGKRTRQPQGPARPNPLFAPAALFSFASPADYVSNKLVTFSASSGIAVNRSGLALAVGGNSALDRAVLNTATDADNIGAGNFTALTRFIPFDGAGLEDGYTAIGRWVSGGAGLTTSDWFLGAGLGFKNTSVDFTVAVGGNSYSAAITGTSWTYGAEYTLIGRRSGTNLYVDRFCHTTGVRDGASANNAGITTVNYTAARKLLSGEIAYGPEYNADLQTVVAALFRRSLTDVEVSALIANPWQLFAPSRRVVVFDGAAGTPTAVTGTLAATDGADVAAFAATHAVPAVTAALAATDGADAAAFAATHSVPAVTAALAATDGADAASFAGESSATPVTATLAATDGADIAAFAATHQISVTATLAATDGADIAAFAATHIASVTAELAATDGADICAFAATHAQAIIATFAATEGADVATFTGRTAGTSIWTDVGVSATTWNDVGGATSIWTDI